MGGTHQQDAIFHVPPVLVLRVGGDAQQTSERLRERKRRVGSEADQLIDGLEKEEEEERLK